MYRLHDLDVNVVVLREIKAEFLRVISNLPVGQTYYTDRATCVSPSIVNHQIKDLAGWVHSSINSSAHGIYLPTEGKLLPIRKGPLNNSYDYYISDHPLKQNTAERTVFNLPIRMGEIPPAMLAQKIGGSLGVDVSWVPASKPYGFNILPKASAQDHTSTLRTPNHNIVISNDKTRLFIIGTTAFGDMVNGGSHYVYLDELSLLTTAFDDTEMEALLIQLSRMKLIELEVLKHKHFIGSVESITHSARLSGLVGFAVSPTAAITQLVRKMRALHPERPQKKETESLNDELSLLMSGADMQSVLPRGAEGSSWESTSTCSASRSTCSSRSRRVDTAKAVAAINDAFVVLNDVEVMVKRAKSKLSSALAALDVSGD